MTRMKVTVRGTQGQQDAPKQAQKKRGVDIHFGHPLLPATCNRNLLNFKTVLIFIGTLCGGRKKVIYNIPFGRNYLSRK
jgi:hypothetical protein